MTSEAPVAAAPALDLACRMRRGELDPVELCESVLAQITGAADPSFLSVTAARASREAARSARRLRDGLSLGPLDGVPVAWKDMFDIRGTVTTAGSRTRSAGAVAQRDARPVAAAAAAGLVSVGKTNLSEFAFSGLGTNPHFGTPVNPHGDGDHVPGGSSAGSAVAVATGAVPLAVGTDTSGSVRVPASFCGVVGYRPSRRAISRRGVLPLAPSLDTVGVFARTVADAAALARVLAARHPAAAPVQPPRQSPVLDVLVPTGVFVDDADPGVMEVFDAALKRIQVAGHRVRRRDVAALSGTRRLLDSYGSLVNAEAYRRYRGLLGTPDAGRLDPHILRRLSAAAAQYSDAAYRYLLNRRRQLQALAGIELSRTVLAMPTVRCTAPRMDAVRDPEAFAAANNRVLANTMTASMLDLPGVSIPIGTDGSGLPVGMLLSTLNGTDEMLLGAANLIEALTRR